MIYMLCNKYAIKYMSCEHAMHVDGFSQLGMHAFMFIYGCVLELLEVANLQAILNYYTLLSNYNDHSENFTKFLILQIHDPNHPL